MLSTKNYVILCVVVALVTAAIILFVPGLSETIESRLLQFLSTNARA